ncbi:MAG TPA: hypothetical protein VGN54_12625 [Mycobacteriales bacterium]|jgi:hypothetical protein|nr:hypothetical protein [Mycobacteriales bacterium]
MSTSPVAEEAAKLVEALQQWFSGATEEIPVASGSAECQLCPFCRLLALARTTKPDVVAHLIGASTELAAAVRAAVAGVERDNRPSPSGVEHIDIGD